MDKELEKELREAIDLFAKLSKEDREMISEDMRSAWVSRVKAVARARKLAAAS